MKQFDFKHQSFDEIDSRARLCNGEKKLAHATGIALRKKQSVEGSMNLLTMKIARQCAAGIVPGKFRTDGMYT